MPEVQNIGAVDYAQYQPSQTQYDDYADYNTQPQVYDEEAADIKSASKSRLGATLLTSAIIAGLALWGGHAWGKKGAAKELESAKNAVEQYEKAMKDIEKAAEEGNNQYFGKNHCGNKLLQKIKDILAPFKQAAKDAKEEATEGAEKAAEDVKKSAEDASK